VMAMRKSTEEFVLLQNNISS